MIDYSANNFIQIFGDQLKPVTRELISWVGGCFSFIDRSGSIDLGLNCKILSPIPKYREVGHINDLMQKRATEILSENAPIDFYWSGGIDSTAALVAMMKAIRYPDQVTVKYSDASVFEYPLFFHRFIDGQIKTDKVSGRVISDVKASSLIVSGEFGDQIFGSVKTTNLFKYSATDAKLADWKVCLPFSDDLKDLFSILVDKCPFRIVSAYDFLWWINFVGKWQHVECRMANTLDMDFSAYMENSRHFFRMEDFQLWAMNEQNHLSKVGHEWTTYKLPLKQYILDFTSDKEYFANKTKVGSLPTYAANHFVIRKDCGKLVSFGQNSSSKVAFSKLFGHTLNVEVFNGTQ